MKELIYRHAALLQELAKEQDSFYLYDKQEIVRRARALQETFPQLQLLYSLKCNPHPGVLHTLFRQGLGADAASLGEVELAAAGGLDRSQIFYSAPGKALRDLRGALPLAVVVADSLGELARLSGLAEETVEAGVRLNPDFTLEQDQGVPSKFGIDEAEFFAFLEAGGLPRVKISGLHVHVKSQELQPARLAGYYRKVLALAEKMESRLGCQLSFLNLGSGIGIPYAPEDREIDLGELAGQAAPLLDSFRRRHPNTRLLLETGRYLVGKSGLYVTRVVDRKRSHGKTYVVLANTLNGFCRPSLAELVEKYHQGSAAPGPAEPLFTGRSSFRFCPLHPRQEQETVTLVGNLCTAADVAAADIRLPRLEVGDLVVITNAGSYAAVLTPMQFSSQRRPSEYLVLPDGRLEAGGAPNN